MAAPLDLLWYGDQSVDSHESIEALLIEAQRFPLLAAFLRRSWMNIKSSVINLPLQDQARFKYGTLQQLSQANLRARDAAVSCTLGCVVQIGWTIWHRGSFPETWKHASPLTIGLCTGTLSALAAAAATSETDLLAVGIEMVLLAFRLGLEVAHRSSCLEEASGSWTAIVSNIPLQSLNEQLQIFHSSQNIPAHRRLYISAKSSTNVSLSGPPSLLSAFLAIDSMHNAHAVRLPIAGAYHASHLPTHDITRIIAASETWNRVVSNRESMLWLSSSSSSVSNLHELIHLTVLDILQTPVDLNGLLHKVKARVNGRSIRLIKIGPSNISNSMLAALSTTEVLEFGLRKEIPNHHHADTEPIAVIGMAGKFPDAENPDELWEILMKGLDLHREIPASRFDVRTHFDPTGKTKNTTLTPYGCFYRNADAFDLAMFRMSPREASQTDPMQRLMLITAYEALECAGYYDSGDPTARPKIGTFYGQGGDDYRQCNSSQDINTNYITGGIRAFGPGRVSYHFGWEGPSMTVDTACSASAVAIHQACSSLWLRECDTALAGGANLLTCSDMFAGLSRASFLSPTGGCKTLDQDADGYCRAESVATVVLKRLDQALKDNDNVLGVIRSIKTNHAANAISITHPDAGAQTALFQDVLDSAGVSIDQVALVEMHGTGTQAGDVAEATSIANLLPGPRPSDYPLYLGAVKPNIGHSEAASGVSSLIKGLLIMRHHVVPRHTGIKSQINPKIPSLEELNIQVPLDHKEIKARPGTNIKMLVNNFNATGGSTALLLEEYYSQPAIERDPRTHHVTAISAATPKSLIRSMKNLLNHLNARPQISLPHLSYTLTARRMHHDYRFSSVAKDVCTLQRHLTEQISRSTQPEKCTDAPSIVFAFTGQASQYAGMGAELFKTCSAFREHLITSESLCKSLNLPSFLDVITSQELDLDVEEPVKCQLALLAIELALANVLETWGVQPSAVIGHSLGEYSALCVSRVISRTDAFFLVGERGLAMQKKCLKNTHAMLAVALPAQEAKRLLLFATVEHSQIACINSPTQTTISGPIQEIERLYSMFCAIDVKCKIIRTSFAFHSAQMDVILDELEHLADGLQFNRPQVPVASACLGQVIKDIGTFGAKYFRQQTREPVQFEAALQALGREQNISSTTVWLELGPAPVCLSMIASTLGFTRLASVIDLKRPNWDTVGSALAEVYRCGGNPRWDEYHKEYKAALKLIQLPSYPFDMTSHWINYEGTWQITKNQCSSAPPLHAYEDIQTKNGQRPESNGSYTPMTSDVSSEAATRGTDMLHPDSPSPEITRAILPKPEPRSAAHHFTNVLELIATEIGVDPQVITDSSQLDELGVDSLMQISIVRKLREAGRNDVPSSLLMQCNSVSQLREFFEG